MVGGLGETQGRWAFVLDKRRHVVSLSRDSHFYGVATTFNLDGQITELQRPTREQLSVPWGSAPLIGVAVLEGHEVLVRRHARRLSAGLEIRRSLSEVLRNPLNLLRGPTGMGSLITTFGWLVYELLIDGQSRGCWVATLRDGFPKRWTFVDAGGDLPQADWPTWPSPR